MSADPITIFSGEATADELLVALMNVLPYAESRAEDMIDAGEDEYSRKAVAAVNDAKAIITRIGGSIKSETDKLRADISAIGDKMDADPILRAAPAMLALLMRAVNDWPQFAVASDTPPQPGCQPDDNNSVNGGDLVEWFGEWVTTVREVVAKAEGLQ
ncbi:hypothetical protein [Chelatococcus asaccharovorans]|uniref:Uncharacterized protein n=1 Tax=Chelatococcus asaccharovorans TaxID=28210 RepID=A0A2V3UB02_9HYPH|nr:hypothetical protein [Chelatococcus asaccharovorans]MBS7703285.1 hypothetical protein [Chelatococcus asaccharovorans]PXW61617.1 hypothetical protein C7450_103134 [Chelatococcus asaccharovorans]